MKASTLALCKFMCVSGSFCEKHLPLLFTALANAPSKDTTLRANTVVALGDLAFRFPNEIEPYTPRLYACLRDQSTKVRRHTLMVLTHLILNDMIKVKGQVCEIAICLRDNDPRIRDMSRLLFHELSKRSNNPIYNLLPEIISQLSLKDIFKEDFRNIMSFLLGFIKKERQNEMLTDKLCQRFSKCSSIDQSADLAFCIAQLKMNEKSIKCLSDNFNLYKDVLFDDDVQKSFLSIVSKTKKILKPERRQQLDEWESKLSEFACVGAENNRASQKAMRAKARALSRGSQKKAQMGLAKDNQVLELSSDAQKENVP
jgi:condensin complex subunit 1